MTDCGCGFFTGIIATLLCCIGISTIGAAAVAGDQNEKTSKKSQNHINVGHTVRFKLFK